jgi:hypothetical protein
MLERDVELSSRVSSAILAFAYENYGTIRKNSPKAAQILIREPPEHETEVLTARLRL